METQNKHDLTQGDVWSKLFGFFIPIAAGGIVQQLYNTADALIVGKYCGTQAFAAISGSVTQILNLMVGAFIALTGGAAVYVAQLYGIGDKEKIKKSVTTSMYLCLGLGILVSILGVIYSEDLLIMLSTPPDTLAEATTYLKFCFAAAFAVMIYNMGASIIRAAGDSTRPFIYLCVCCITNIVLDYVLVKIYSLGVWGAAAATAFSQLVSCALVLIQMFSTQDAYKLSLSPKNLSLNSLKFTLKYGIPSSAQQIIYGVTNTVIQAANNTLGTVVVAAWGLTGKVDGVYWAIINAAGISIMNFVGQNYGAGKMDRVKSATKIGMRNFMIFTIVICALLVLFGKPLFPLFLDDEETTSLAYEIMLYFVIPYFLWTVIELMSGVLKGCGDAIVPAIICLVGIAGTRLVWMKVVFPLHPTVFVSALSYGISWIVTAIALLVRYKGGKWKKRKEL